MNFPNPPKRLHPYLDLVIQASFWMDNMDIGDFKYRSWLRCMDSRSRAYLLENFCRQFAEEFPIEVRDHYDPQEGDDLFFGYTVPVKERAKVTYAGRIQNAETQVDIYHYGRKFNWVDIFERRLFAYLEYAFKRHFENGDFVTEETVQILFGKEVSQETLLLSK